MIWFTLLVAVVTIPLLVVLVMGYEAKDDAPLVPPRPMMTPMDRFTCRYCGRPILRQDQGGSCPSCGGPIPPFLVGRGMPPPGPSNIVIRHGVIERGFSDLFVNPDAVDSRLLGRERR